MRNNSFCIFTAMALGLSHTWHKSTLPVLKYFPRQNTNRHYNPTNSPSYERIMPGLLNRPGLFRMCFLAFTTELIQLPERHWLTNLIYHPTDSWKGPPIAILTLRNVTAGCYRIGWNRSCWKQLTKIARFCSAKLEEDSNPTVKGAQYSKNFD